MPTTVTGTTTTVSGLTPGTLYRFRVRARNSVGYGPYSAWSEAGTPVGGPTPPPPPPEVTLSVGISGLAFTALANTWNGSATALAKASDSSALLGSVTYTWQGRYRRSRLTNMPAWTFGTDGSPTWQNLSSSGLVYTGATSGSQADPSKFYLIEASGNASLLRAIKQHWAPNNGTFPDNFWELRCTATASYILNGVSGTASGTSRTIAFKEMWSGTDYPTIIGGGIL